MIELRGVSRSYREGGVEHHILRAVDATILAGEFVVILGRSGSGKSTLLNLVGGIDRPDSGEIRVAGCSVAAMDETARTLFRRRRIGFVFQFFNLIATLSVLENVLLPLELTGMERAAARPVALGMLAEVCLDQRAEAFPDRLSGGEQQRVAIARALVHEPDVVLADEPTGNLDIETGEEVLELLDRLVRSRGRTLLMATHSREVAARADRALRLVDGRLMELEQDVDRA